MKASNVTSGCSCPKTTPPSRQAVPPPSTQGRQRSASSLSSPIGSRHRIKSLISALLTVLMLLSVIGCSAPDTRESVVCSSPVIAEWTRAVLGEDAQNLNIVTLGALGADVHSYQPTVRDIAAVARCSVFIRNGGESETWADGMIAAASNEEMHTLSLCDAMEELLCSDGGSEHDAHDGHDVHDGHAHEGHAHEYDEHIWISFDLACESVSHICRVLSEARPDMAHVYSANAAEYIRTIREIESEYAELRTECSGKVAVLCDRDPFHYLWEFLGLECEAAYEGCSAESEATFSVVARLSRVIDERGVRCVLVCESSDGGIADAVISATEQKNARILTLDSMQSSLDSPGYLEALRSNLAVLKTALANGETS